MKTLLIQNKIIKEGHFKLTSGLHSNIYINKDMIYTNSVLFNKIILSFKTILLSNILHINEKYIFTGPAIAGAILASHIAREMFSYSPFIYPEKIDNRMVFRRGYDKIIEGKAVIIIEDIITTGGSVQKVVNAIKYNGGDVALCACIWNRTGWQHDDFPVQSLIDEKIESWEPGKCPICKEGIELTDPKRI